MSKNSVTENIAGSPNAMCVNVSTPENDNSELAMCMCCTIRNRPQLLLFCSDMKGVRVSKRLFGKIINPSDTKILLTNYLK